jgi:hypothetical protein
LIREIHQGLNSTGDRFDPKHPLGTSRKIARELMPELGGLTRRHPHFGCMSLWASMKNRRASLAKSTLSRLVMMTDVLEGWGCGQNGKQRHEVFGGLDAAEKPDARQERRRSPGCFGISKIL